MTDSVREVLSDSMRVVRGTLAGSADEPEAQAVRYILARLKAAGLTITDAARIAVTAIGAKRSHLCWVV